LIDFIKKIDLIQPNSLDELETKIQDANKNNNQTSSALNNNDDKNQTNFENFYDDYFS
jgi:hypothetical protein